MIACNVVFGLAHYFTLRWRWQWCLFAFAGGMGFSHNLHQNAELLPVIVIHWIVTYLNTPRMPGSNSGRS